MSSTEIIKLVSSFKLDENFSLKENDFALYLDLIKKINHTDYINEHYIELEPDLQISVKNSILSRSPEETYKYYLLFEKLGNYSPAGDAILENAINYNKMDHVFYIIENEYKKLKTNINLEDWVYIHMPIMDHKRSYEILKKLSFIKKTDIKECLYELINNSFRLYEPALVEFYNSDYFTNEDKLYYIEKSIDSSIFNLINRNKRKAIHSSILHFNPDKNHILKNLPEEKINSILDKISSQDNLSYYIYIIRSIYNNYKTKRDFIFNTLYKHLETKINFNKPVYISPDNYQLLELLISIVTDYKSEDKFKIILRLLMKTDDYNLLNHLIKLNKNENYSKKLSLVL